VGKPLEFAKKHTITYDMDYTDDGAAWDTGTFDEALGTSGTVTEAIEFMPILENGVRGEARLWMPELINKTIVDAYEFGGKLWVFSADTVGYIIPSGGGYKYVHLSEDFGIIADTLDVGDGLVYGCDSSGAWVLDGNLPRRLSDGIVEPSDDLVTIDRAQWKNATKEYWFGDSASAYIYNARLDTITSRSVQYGGVGVYDPICLLWFKANENIKEDIEVTVLAKEPYNGLIRTGDFPADVDTEATGTYTFDQTKNNHKMSTNSSGRYVGILVSGQEEDDFILSGIHIDYKGVSEYERAYR